MFKEFSYKSSDKKNDIYAVRWETKNNPKAVLQIAHGMTEHIMRYDVFAKFLIEQGIMVCGNDHLGHGKTAKSDKELGYFAEQDGHKLVVDDMKKLYDIVSKDYPNTPYFLLGHSMGSFMCREFIERYGDCITGAIVMGTGQQPQALLSFTKTLAKIMAFAKGWNHRSNLIDNLAFGAYNRKFKPIKTGHEWLSRSESNAIRYQDDPLCGYVFTLNGFYNLFDVISYIEKKNHIDNIPKDLPILIVSGADDPVGSYGKGPKKVKKDFDSAGIKDVKLKLYDKDRHEILNELDKEEVYKDILNWMESVFKKKEK